MINMSGPTTCCVRCNEPTPMRGCWGKNALGEVGELCRTCEPNPFVNPRYVHEAARALAARRAQEPDFDAWAQELDGAL